MKNKFIWLISPILAWVSIQTNYGQSWQALQGPKGTTIETAILTREKGELYCLSGLGKIYYSADKGNTWENRSQGLPERTSTVHSKLLESTIGEVFLAYERRIYRWNDGNKNWDKLVTALDEIEDFAISPDGHRIYFGSTRYFYFFDIQKGVNSNLAWITHSVEFLSLGNGHNYLRKTLGASGEIWIFNDDGSNLRKIKDTRALGSLYYHQHTGTLFDYDFEFNVSLDYGISWSKKNTPSGDLINELLTLKDGSLLGFGQDIYRSYDGGLSWNKDLVYNNSKMDYMTYKPYTSQSQSGEILVNAYSRAFLLNSLGQLIDIQLPVVEPNIYSVDQIGESKILCTTSNSCQYSSNGGRTWQIVNIGENMKLHLWDDGTMMYAGSDSMFFSNDLFLTKFAKPLPEVVSVGLFKTSQGHLVLYAIDNIYISFDKGDSWSLIGHTSGLHFFSELKMSRQNILYTTKFPDTICYSVDFGLSWKSFYTKGIDDIYGITLTQNNVFWWYAYDDNFNYNLFYSTDFGVSAQKFEPDASEEIVYIDEFENIYTRPIRPSNKLTYTQILTKVVNDIPTDGILNLGNGRLNLYRGDNDSLYAITPYAPLYKCNVALINGSGLISGRILMDENMDCIRDTLENKAGLFTLALKEQNRSVVIPVNPNGEFKSFVLPGNYEMQLQGVSPIWMPCNFPTEVIIKDKDSVEYQNLLVQPVEQCADLFSSLVLNRLRRCFENNGATLKISNKGSSEAQNVVIKVRFDDYFEDIKASENPSSINGNTWAFILPKISPWQTFVYNFQFKVSCMASLGQEHCIHYEIDNPNECMTFLPSVDSILICDDNIGAFDPNDKTAFVKGKSETVLLATDTLIQYLIRFQNTGTDTAFNIRIDDKLDYGLDWSTFIPIDASHPYHFKLAESGKLEILFTNILLPDSSIDESHSHGYFLYNIHPKTGLRVGTVISNTAGIIFDYNEPVLTNVALLKLKQTTGYKEPHLNQNRVLVSVPNPASDFSEVNIPEGWLNLNVYGSLYSFEGRYLQSLQREGNKFKIERKNLPNGMYYALLFDEFGNRVFAKIIFE